MWRFQFLGTLVFILFMGMATNGLTKPTAAARELSRRLSTRVSLLWQGQELRTALRRLEERHGIAIWLDRRVDPNQQFDLTISDSMLYEALKAIANSCDARAVCFESLVYLGPQETAEELATLNELASKSLLRTPAGRPRRWLENSSPAWDTPTEPKQLLERLASECGANLSGAELLPHDLWHPNNYPAMRRIQWATLLLAGFDLQCRVDLRTGNLLIEQLERPVVIRKKYASKPKLQSLLEEHPPASQRIIGNEQVVAGTVEYHQRLQDLLDGKQPTSRSEPSRSEIGNQPANDQLKFTLTIKNQPVGAVLDQIAKQLKLEVEWDDEAEARRNELVNCQVKEVPLEGLMRAVLAPAKLQAVKTDSGYRVESAGG
ncbi:hypothetical protein [Adhaeretor mobilis]|uniref:Uncharacterized protein n=1 Tax=Adhaeretor mobilis TaxID=1930276 RepID=A0A517MY21_9BACT|nr:hypothetical protein [Adhaeretor mobilis]QDS99774.1 hypothetical protein HG15A2_31050 [Adhaeretor mobilis]